MILMVVVVVVVVVVVMVSIFLSVLVSVCALLIVDHGSVPASVASPAAGVYFLAMRVRNAQPALHGDDAAQLQQIGSGAAANVTDAVAKGTGTGGRELAERTGSCRWV